MKLQGCSKQGTQVAQVQIREQGEEEARLRSAELAVAGGFLGENLMKVDEG